VQRSSRSRLPSSWKSACLLDASYAWAPLQRCLAVAKEAIFESLSVVDSRSLVLEYVQSRRWWSTSLGWSASIASVVLADDTGYSLTRPRVARDAGGVAGVSSRGQPARFCAWLSQFRLVFFLDFWTWT
jgi:hypothetical protein